MNSAANVVKRNTRFFSLNCEATLLLAINNNISTEIDMCDCLRVRMIAYNSSNRKMEIFKIYVKRKGREERKRAIVL